MSDIALKWGIGSADFDRVTAPPATGGNIGLPLPLGEGAELAPQMSPYYDLVLDEGLETALSLSIFTDRRAEEGDPLPAGETDRRGWWADALADDPLDRFGSRLWLLAREKQTAAVLGRAQDYIREALQWLVDDHAAESVSVNVEFVSRGMLGIDVEVQRPKADPVKFRFNYLWAAQAARQA